MRNMKKALLVGATSLLSVGVTHAADLPAKAKPVEYVKVCSLYGAGFYYMPGTDICFKLGGYLRFEADYNAAGTINPAVGPGSANNRANINNRESNSTQYTRTRSLWTLDTRQQTDYGMLRTYSRTGIQWSTGDSNNAGSNAVAYIDRAFLQFGGKSGGLTAGRTVSYFDIYTFSLHSFQSNIIGSDSGGTGINLVAWTTDLGGGFTAAISAEEHQTRSKPIVNTIGTAGFLNLNNNAGGAPGNFGSGTFTSQAGQVVPNLVANLRLDQAWGTAQVSAGANRVAAAYYSTSTAAAGGGTALALGGGAGGLQSLGHPDDKWGFAGTAGTVLNLPSGKGDTFGFQAVYSKGASGYAAQGQGTFNIVHGGRFGAGFVTDAVYGGVGTQLDLTTAWSVTAGVQHYWTPSWRTSLFGGYEGISYDSHATATLCAGLAPGGAGSSASAGGFTPTNCSPNFGFWQIGSRTVWSPVASLDIGMEVLYNRVNTAFAGPVTIAANGTLPAGVLTASDQGELSGAFRIQRNFVP
jgi:hypothetical protein